MTNIGKLREKAGLMQEDVSVAMNVSQSAVSQWETGRCFPKTELLPKLADLFKCSINDLYDNLNEIV